MRRRTISNAATLCLHDAFDEVKSQTVTGYVGSDVSSAIERLEQLSLVRRVNARPVVDHAHPNFLCPRIVLRDDINLRFVSALSVLECIAQQVLNTLRQCTGIGFDRRKIWINTRRQFALF